MSPAALWHCSARSSATPCAQGIRIDNPAHGVVKFAEGRRQRRLIDDEYRHARQGAVDGGSGGCLEASYRRYMADDPDGMAPRRSAGSEMVGDRSATTNCTLADTKTGASIRPLSELTCAVIQSQPRIGDLVFPSRSGETPIVGYRKMWLRIAKLGDLPADITPHVLRHSFASLAADLGYNEPTIASLLGHKTHSITSRYVHSADAVLMAAADAVANATMKLMGEDVDRGSR